MSKSEALQSVQVRSRAETSRLLRKAKFACDVLVDAKSVL